jgi:drug/metabolite transporter (DMT)-like permease
MWLVVDAVDVTMRWGVWAGLAAALLVTVFAILNKKMIHKADPLSISFVELSAAWLFLSLLLPFYFASGDVQLRLPSASDWLYLLILALLCTTLAYVLSLRSLRHLSAFATNLTVNLEPVYGIFLAWILLGENEEVSPNFYWGVVIIMVAVFSYPLLRKRFGKEEEGTRNNE